LGLLRKDLPEDKELFDSLLEVMKSAASDWTNTFRHLSTIEIPTNPLPENQEETKKEKESDSDVDEEQEETVKEALEYLVKQGMGIEALRYLKDIF
jgi:uncharacterized protein YdiU (UPF0061 family)